MRVKVNTKHIPKLLLWAMLGLFIVGFSYFVFKDRDLQILTPAGPIATEQKSLLTTATFLGLIVIIPVFFLVGFITWKYRASNKKSTYTPDWDSNKLLEFVWWGIPCIIISILGVITWRSSHSLDPFRPINSSGESKTIQVVALQWKWLFIYPEEKIATVNYLVIPKGTPVRFEITADAPMNSFWIPKLGGQIYAMSGMATELNLRADSIGRYKGVSANISGAGFAGMDFMVESVEVATYEKWVDMSQLSTSLLNMKSYESLLSPSENNEPAFYKLDDLHLFNEIIEKYNEPGQYKEPDEYHTGAHDESTEEGAQ